MIQNPALIKDELARIDGLVDVHLAEYRITMGYLHLVLTGREFHEVRANLYFGDCYFICGETHAAQCRVELVLLRENGQDVLAFSTQPVGLTIKALRATLELPGDLRPKEEPKEDG